MKKLYRYIFALLFCLNIVNLAIAQSDSRVLSPVGDPILQQRHTSEFTIINPGDDIANIEILYNQNSFFNNYFLAQSALRSAQVRAWYETQNNIVRDEINQILQTDQIIGGFRESLGVPSGQNFPTFQKAQEALYKATEVDLVAREIGHTKNIYKGKVAEKQKIRDICLRNIKLLDFRANEINSGNVNNSTYGHIKLYGNGDTPLKDIKTINQINDLRAQEVNTYSDNQWRLDQEQNIKELLEGLQLDNQWWDSRNFDPNNGLLQELYSKQLSYYNSHSDFLRLGLIQLSLDRLKNRHFYGSPYSGVITRWGLPTEYRNLRINVYGDSNYIGDYAIRQSPENQSIFHDDFWNLRIQSQPWNTNYWLRQKVQAQTEALNNALNDFDLGKALTEAAIAGLGVRNEDYINDRPTLKAEIENYFSLNDHSKLSHDCANYLLNQYLGNGHFTLGENYYASADIPRFNNSFNPNLAIGTDLNAIAKRDEFTYLNNVLAALLNDSVHRPEYKGQIIREVFEANGINIPAGLDNATLANYFNFAPTAADSMRIDHARGHGVKTNLDQYLNDLKDFHNTVQDMLQNAPTGINQVAYVDYENRIVEVLNFTNDADALEIANMFQNEIARNRFLQLQHHRAITDSAQDMLQAGFNEGLEFSKMANRDPEGLRIVTHEAAEISAIDDIAEDVGENGSSFWPQNAQEWQAFGEMMVPLLGEILIGFTPAGDYYDLLTSIDSGDVLGASLAIGGIIISSTSLGPIKGAIKGARAFRKALKVYRKVRGVLGAVGKLIKKGYKVAVEAGQLVLKKAGRVIAQGDDAVKGLLRKLDGLTDAQLNKFDDLVEEAARKGQKWDNPEAVADALKKVSDGGVDGVSLSHKKFPTPADGSDSFTLKNAKQYQLEASGDAALSFNKNGVSFDNIANGKLIDRKFGHSSVFDSAGNVANSARADSLVEQARRQLNAAGGNPVRWEISSVGGTNGIKRLFRDRGINIEVVHVPQITIIP